MIHFVFTAKVIANMYSLGSEPLPPDGCVSSPVTRGKKSGLVPGISVTPSIG